MTSGSEGSRYINHKAVRSLVPQKLYRADEWTGGSSVSPSDCAPTPRRVIWCQAALDMVALTLYR